MPEDRLVSDATQELPVAHSLDALDAGEAANLPPLELTLAANAAMEHAHRVSESDWRASKADLAAQPPLPGIGHADATDRLAQAIANLRAANLWPWRWLSTKEAARRLGVNDSRVRQLIIAGELPARPAATGVGYIVDDEAIGPYLAANPQRRQGGTAER